MTLTKLNLGVAFAAITSNSWLPSLAAVSSWAALWVPILGFCLLVLQIAKLIWDWMRKPKRD
jgi:hypothetical protein